MPSDHTRLAPPHLLLDYRGIIEVKFKFDDTVKRSCQPVDFISVPECPVQPLVVVQPIDDSRRPNGAAWAYQPDGNRGRGDWAIYDPDFHEIPSSQPLTEAGTDSPELDDEVELSEEESPVSYDPPFDDEFDGEDDVTAS